MAKDLELQITLIDQAGGSNMAAAARSLSGSGTVNMAGLSSGGGGGSLAAAGLAGGIAGVAASATMAAIQAGMAKVSQSIADLSAVSGAVSSAQAMASVRELQTQIRRDRVVGGDVARFVNSRSLLEQQVAEINTQILRFMVPAMTAAVDTLRAVLPLLEKLAEKFADSATEALEAAKKESRILITDGVMGFKEMMSGVGGIGLTPMAGKITQLLDDILKAVNGRDAIANPANEFREFVRNRTSRAGIPLARPFGAGFDFAQ